MKVSILFAVVSTLAGLRGAYMWWLASKVDYRPFDERGNQVPDNDSAAWMGALKRTVHKSGHLNKSGALWTAIAVLAGGASVLVAAVGY